MNASICGQSRMKISFQFSTMDSEWWKEISPTDLYNRIIISKFPIVDYRNEDDFRKLRIRGSLHAQIDKLPALSLVTDTIQRKEPIKKTVVILFPREHAFKLSDILEEFKQLIISQGGIFAGMKDENQTASALFLCQLFVLSDAHVFFSKYEAYVNLLENEHGYTGNRMAEYASEIIDDALYLGDYASATSKHELQAHGITHIVDATNVEMSKDISNQLGITYVSVAVWDEEDANIAEFFDTTNAFIHEALTSGGKVLVHCRAGWSRSPSLVIGYLLRHTQASLNEALERVVRARPMVCPNAGFLSQLLEYEKRVAQPGGNPLSHCRNSDELRAFILSVSQIELSISTMDLPMERIPIQAFKTTFAFKEAEEYPDPGNSTITQKPKKPFLKKGSRQQHK